MAARLTAPSSNLAKTHKDADALIRTVCAVAGSMSFLDEIDEEIRHAGLDQAVASGKPRGARFPELKDSIASVAMEMNCRVLIDQPDAVSALGMKLPVGRVHGGGKVVKLQSS